MPPPARKLHQLRISRKNGAAYTYYGSRWNYLGKWDSAKNEPTPDAMKRFEDLRALWRADPLSAPSSLESPLLLSLWADWLESPQAPTKRPEDTDRVERLLFGTEEEPGPHEDTRAADFTAGDFLDWQTELCGYGYSAWVVGQCRRILLELFDWAAIKGKVDESQPASLARVKPPTQGASAGQVKPTKVQTPVNEADFRKAIPFLRLASRAACELMWFTAARPSEVLTLVGCDLVRTGKIVTAKGAEFEIPRGMWAAARTQHKMMRKGFDRVLFFGKRSWAVLEALEMKPERLLFLSQRGQAYHHKSLGSALKRACRRAGVPIFTPYQIRHGAAVATLREFSEPDVGVWMGHKSRGITGRYAGTDLKTAAKVAGKMG